MRNILVALVGMRDPIHAEPLQARSADPAGRHAAFLAFAEELADAGVGFADLPREVDGVVVQPGPIGTALAAAAKSTLGRIYELRLVVAHQMRRDSDGRLATSDEMRRRAELLRRFAPSAMASDAVARVDYIDCQNVADYEDAFRVFATRDDGSSRTKIEELLDAKPGERVHVLLGPGTPQLNVALLFHTLQSGRKVGIWQIKNPKELADRFPTLESVPAPELKRLRFGSETLPDLRDGRSDAPDPAAAAELERLRQRVAQLEADRPDHGSPVSDPSEGPAPGENLDAYLEAVERRCLLRARADHLALCSATGRKPTQTGLAEHLGLSRQNLAKKLAKHGIEPL